MLNTCENRILNFKALINGKEGCEVQLIGDDKKQSTCDGPGYPH
jgi:hypothetical protein